MDCPRPVVITLLTIGLFSYALSGDGVERPGPDSEWDWDMLYDEYENEFWVCRGVQTEQLADAHLCSPASQDDDRWPEPQVCW